MSSRVGNNDSELSDHLKAFIQTRDALVVGIIGEGSSRELTAMWEAPFENETPGAMLSKTSGLAQMGTDTTSKTKLNTTQVWSGTMPLVFSLVLELYAIHDAYAEVQAAVVELEKAASPELNGATPMGRIPEKTIALNAGRQIIYPECVITSISRQLDGPISHEGYPLQGQLTLQLETVGTVNRSDIPSTFG